MNKKSPDQAKTTEPNPYSASTNCELPERENPKPGSIAVFLGVVVAIVFGLAASGLSFFVTCLGLATEVPGGIAMFIMIPISIATFCATFLFSLWIFLKIVEALKSR